MPSQRKRIGFLPSEEVHEIIEKICLENKLSQSRLTGILVEEALISNGYLNKSSYNNKFKNKNSISNSFIYNNYPINSKQSIYNDIDLKDDLQMINEFIEYKFFKNVMRQNNIRLN